MGGVWGRLSHGITDTAEERDQRRKPGLEEGEGEQPDVATRTLPHFILQRHVNWPFRS